MDLVLCKFVSLHTSLFLEVSQSEATHKEMSFPRGISFGVAFTLCNKP
jgi:hypothetical protein